MTYSFRTYHLRCPFLSSVSIERCACVLDSGEPPLLAVDHLLGVSARRGAACSCVLRNLLRPDLGGAVPIWIRTQDRELVAISLPLHNPMTRHPTTTPHLNHQPSTPLAPRLCAGPLQPPRAHFSIPPGCRCRLYARAICVVRAGVLRLGLASAMWCSVLRCTTWTLPALVGVLRPVRMSPGAVRS